MGVNDCQCLAVKLITLSGGHLHLGQVSRSDFDRIVAMIGGRPYFSSGNDEFPSGWVAISVQRDGMSIYVQAFATEEDREAAVASLSVVQEPMGAPF